MTSLKSFLPVLSDIFDETPDALYSRQRALMTLGVMDTKAGRGPGSGAPLTAKNVAALVISLLAANTLGEVDERILKLCTARPSVKDQEKWGASAKKLTFLDAVTGSITGGFKFSGSGTLRSPRAIRVTQPWRGQIIGGLSSSRAFNFYTEPHFDVGEPLRSLADSPVHLPITRTTEIEERAFNRLLTCVDVAVAIAENDGDDE